MSLDPLTGLPEKKPTKTMLNMTGLSLPSTGNGPNVDIQEAKRLGIQSYNPLSNDTQKQLGQFQSNSEQLGYGIARLSNVVPEIIGNFASIADIEDYWNQDKEVGNVITRAMMDWKDATREALPIHRENPNKHLDIGDFAWWAENGSELTTSIGGFAATGALLGGPLSFLSKFGKGGQYTGVFLNAVALNQAESIQEAIPVYDDIYKQGIISGLNSDEARENAAKSAATVVNLNRVNILLNITSANMFIKSASGRGFVNQVTKKNTVKKSIGELLQEGTEELVNLKSSKEGTRKGEALIKGEEYDSSSYFTNFVEDVVSMEGAEAFILGAVGGIGQTYVSAGIGNVDNKYYTGKFAKQRKAYAAQQERVKELKDLIDLPKDQSEVFMGQGAAIDLMDRIKNASNANEKAKLEELLISEQVFNNASKEQGLETLTAVYNTFTEMTPQQAEEKGLPKDYKERAQTALKMINKFGNYANIANNFKKSKQVYNNLIYREQILSDIGKERETLSQKEQELSKITDEVLDGAYSFEEIKDSKEFDKVKNLPEYKALEEAYTELNSLKDSIEANILEYGQLTSEESEAESVKEIKKDENKVKGKAAKAAANPKPGQNPLEMMGLSPINEDGSSVVAEKQDDEATPVDVSKMMAAFSDVTEDGNPIESNTEEVPVEPAPTPTAMLEGLNARYNDKDVLKATELKELAKALGKENITVEEVNELFYNDNAAKSIISDFYTSKKENKEAREASKDTETGTQDGTKSNETGEQVTPKKKAYDPSHVILTFDRVFNESTDVAKRKSISEPAKHPNWEERYQDGIDMLNNPNVLLEGETVHFEYDPEHPYNKTNPSVNNIVVEIVYYKDGNVNNKTKENKIILGKLKGNSKISSKYKLKNLRSYVWSEFNKESDKTKPFNSGITTTIKTKLSGPIWTIKEDLNPLKTLASDESFVLGVAVLSENGVVFEVPNDTSFGEEYQNVLLDSKHSLSSGNSYMLIKNNRGEVIPFHLNVSDFVDAPQEHIDAVEELIESLTNKNYKEVSKKISSYVNTFITGYNPDTKRISISEYVISPETGEKVKVNKTYTLDDYRAILYSTKSQVDKNKINKGDYNEKLANSGVITANLNPIIHTHSGGIEISSSLNYSKPGETVEDDNATTETVEDKKADIERRRQEELLFVKPYNKESQQTSIENINNFNKSFKKDGTTIKVYAATNSKSKLAKEGFSGENTGLGTTKGESKGTVFLTPFLSTAIDYANMYAGEGFTLSEIDIVEVEMKNGEGIVEGDEIRTRKESIIGTKGLNLKQDSENIIKKINAKYDAELAALEPTTKSTETVKNKIGVSEVFTENPDLASIGTEKQYSEYLDTIFPDSKVKDIVYHGTKSADKILEEGFKEGFEGTANKGVKGFHFAFEKEDADYFANKDGKVLLALVNVTNEDLIDVDEILIYSNDRINILGSKQDIKGFKKFVNNLKTKSTEVETFTRVEGKYTFSQKTIKGGTVNQTIKNNENGSEVIKATKADGFVLFFLTGSFEGVPGNMKGLAVSQKEIETVLNQLGVEAKNFLGLNKPKQTNEVETNQRAEPVPVSSQPTASTLSYGDEILAKIDEIKNNRNFIKLENNNPNADFYVDSRTGKKYRRVTSTFSDGVPSSVLLSNASAIGTNIDTITRDFFEGKLKTNKEYKAFKEDTQFSLFVEELQELKSKFDETNETVIGDDILLYDDTTLDKDGNGVAGTVDLLTVDKKGVVRIYDLKTKRSGIKNVDVSYEGGKTYMEKWTLQLSLYRILLYNTHNILASDLQIIPIKVSYSDKKKDIKTGNALFLYGEDSIGLKIDALDEVKGLKFGIGTAKLNDGKVETLGNNDWASELKPSDHTFKDNPATSRKTDEDTKSWDKKKELAKLSKILPSDIAVKVVDDVSKIFNVNAWGVYHDAVIYLNSTNKRGTAYHEAFHAVYRSILNSEERANLLAEAVKQFAAPTDSEFRSYKEWYGDRAMYVWYEEQMADAYADYSLANDDKYSGFTGAIKKLFDRIKMWFGIINKHNNVVEELFYKIEDGSFKNSAINRKTSFTKPATSLKKMNATDKMEAIDHFKHLFNVVLDEIRDVKGYDPSESDVDIINKEGGIHPIMNHVFTMMMRHRLSAQETAPKIADAYHNITINWIASKPIKVKPKTPLPNLSGEFVFDYIPGQLYFDAVKSLKDFGIVIKKDAIVEEVKTKSESFQEVLNKVEDEEITTYESYQISANQVSSKERLSGKIKRKFANIEKKDYEGNVKIDKFGFPVYEDYNEIYRYLEQNISNIYNAGEMLNKLYELQNSKPFISNIIALLENDAQLRSEVFTSISAKQLNHYLYLKQDKKGIKIFGSNRVGIRNVIINDLRARFHYSKLIDKGEINNKEVIKFKKRFEEIVGELNKPDSYTRQVINNRSVVVYNDSVVNDLYSLFNEYGIDVSLDQLKGLASSGAVSFKKFLGASQNSKGIKSLISLLENGKNPLAIIDATDNESSTLESIAKELVPVSKNIYELSFRNVEDKNVYAHNSSNFLHKKMVEFAKNKQVRDAYLGTAFYKNSFLLKELSENAETGENFIAAILDGFKPIGKNKGVAYDAMNKQQLETTVINAYHNNGSKSYGYYRFPVLADAPQLPLIKYKKHTADEVIDHMYSVVLQEMAGYEALQNSEEVSQVKNVKERKKVFLLLPFMNDYKGNLTDVKSVKAYITKNLNEGLDKELKRLTKLGLLKATKVHRKTGGHHMVYTNTSENLLPATAMVNGSLKQFIAEYYYNSKLMNTQSISLFSGDLHFYKSATNWQKRNKQVWSPKQYLDTTDINDFYATVYLKDNEIPSSNELKEFIRNTLKDHPKSYVDSIVAMYDKNNETDGQSYITLERYKEIWEGLGRWTRAHELAYDKALNSETLTSSEYGLFSIIKPFQFTHKLIDNIIVPVQNKNSEFVLMPQFVDMDKSGKMRKIYDQLQDVQNKTGLRASAQFESAVKVGLYGQGETVDNSKIHKLSNSDFGLQVETPPHYLDFDVTFGTQIRKLIMSDISPDAIFDAEIIPEIQEIFGKDTVTFSELLSVYQETIGKDLEEGYKDAKSITKDNDRISEYLTEAAEDRSLGQNLIDSIQVDSTGNFTLDLFHPLHSKRNENLLNALYKNKVTKQKISGGQFINVSSYGFSDELNIITKGDNFIHMEAIMPFWTKKLFKGLLDDNGEIDINKIEDKRLLDLIAYRIPTEDKYSMFKLRVVGFSPQGTGGAVILPREATTLAGLDFDVDKLFGMMFNFEEVNGKPVMIKPSMDTKESRDNLKLSLMLGILGHNESTASIFQPGGFDNLKNNALNVRLYKMGLEPSDYIKETLSKTIEAKEDILDSEELDLTEPFIQTELFSRNMTGKNLIGIFANHNVNHAISQLTNLSVSEDIAPTFDGVQSTSLHSIKALDGLTNISRNGATFLAAVVDNAGDPIAEFLNVNTFTADTVAYLIRLGHDLDTVMMFISQPSLAELSEDVFSKNAVFGEEDKLLNEKINDKINEIKSVLKIDVKPTFQSYNKEQLINYHKVDNVYQKEKNTLDGKQLVEKYQQHFMDQLDVLYTFKQIRLGASELSTVVGSTRPDATGAGPTMSQNESNMRKKELLDNLKFIEGQDAFYGDSELTIIKNFEKYGIEKPTEDLSRLFPWQNATFMEIKDALEDNKVNARLSAEEIEFVNYSIYSYIASSKDYLSNRTKQIDLLSKFPERLMKYKASNPNNKFVERFLNRFQVTPYNNDPSFMQVRFHSTGMDATEKENLTKVWEQMFHSPDAEIASLAKDLSSYSFMTSAFMFTPYGFGTILPVTYYTSLMSEEGELFNDWFRDKVTNTEISEMDNSFYENFYIQFIQNNFAKSSFVKAVTQQKGKGNVDALYYAEGVAKVKITKKHSKKWKNNLDAMPDFIKYQNDTKWLLFTLEKSENGVYEYTQAKTLGMPGLLVEYSPEGNNYQSVNSDNKVGIDIDLSASELARKQSEEIEEITDAIEETNEVDVKTEVDTNTELTPEQKAAKMMAAFSNISDTEANDKKKEC
jgi:hypothetical protein